MFFYRMVGWCLDGALLGRGLITLIQSRIVKALHLKVFIPCSLIKLLIGSLKTLLYEIFRIIFYDTTSLLFLLMIGNAYKLFFIIIIILIVFKRIGYITTFTFFYLITRWILITLLLIILSNIICYHFNIICSIF